MQRSSSLKAGANKTKGALHTTASKKLSTQRKSLKTNKGPVKAKKSVLMTTKRRLADRPGSVEFPNGSYTMSYNEEPTLEQTPMFHSDVNPERPEEYWDYESFVPSYGNEENYEISGKLADGKNSVVLSGFAVNSNVELCMKVMKPIAPNKVKRQALALTNLKNLPHVQNLLDICLEPQSRTTTFVTMYAPHEPFESFQDNLTTDEATTMAFQLMDGLDNVHSKGIIHRNIHPGNVLMNPKGAKKELTIVDFDNCEFFHPATAYVTSKITKRGWASPEMALNMPDYHYAHDVWGAALIVAKMFFPTESVFQIQKGQSEIDFIAQIVGSENLATMIQKYNAHHIINADTVVPALQANYQKVDFKKLKSKNITPGIIDLLERTLIADFDFRVLPFEATCLDVFAPFHDDYEEMKNDPDAKYDPTFIPESLPAYRPGMQEDDLW